MWKDIYKFENICFYKRVGEMNEIDYSDKNEWKKFVSDYIIPLRDSADTLVEYWNYLKRKIDGVEVDEIEGDLKPILLGGVDVEGNYLEESTAKFYKDFFGVSLSVELPKYVTAKKEEAAKGIKGIVREIETQPYPNVMYFIKFVRDVAGQTKKIANIALSKGVIDTVAEPSREIDEKLVGKPEDDLKQIENFYKRCAMITPNHNEHTLFTLTIRTITRRYLEEEYPEFKEKIDELKGLFGLNPLFTPNIEDTQKKEYTIWHLSDGSFGGEIKRLFVMVWYYNSIFNGLLSQYFTGITDLVEDFVEMAKSSVSSLSSEILKINELITQPSYLQLDYEQRKWIRDWNSFSRYGSYPLLVDPQKALYITQALDEVSPFLFAGVIYIDDAKESSIGFKPIKEPR